MSEKNMSTFFKIILIVLVLFVGLRFIPFMLLNAARSVGVHVPRMAGLWTGGFAAHKIMLFLPSVFFFLWLAVVVWVYKDAERRNMDGLLWAMLVFIGNVVALIIYLIVRADEMKITAAYGTRPCPSCKQPVAENYMFCPHCGAKMETACPACGKPVAPDWKVCPFCGKALASE